MSFILSRKRSDQQLARGLEQITAWPPLPAQRFAGKQATLGRRTAPFLIVFCIGFAITLTCRSYGDATTITIVGAPPHRALPSSTARPVIAITSLIKLIIMSPPPEPTKLISIGL